jgi:hypothetical protein
MYEPVHIPGRLTRRRVLVALFVTIASLIAIGVTVVRTMPHSPPVDPLTLDDLQQIIPDAAQTELVATLVAARIAQMNAATPPPAPATAPACVAASSPHTWDSIQRANAKTIVQVGLALAIPKRGEVVAVAAAMQESQLRNLGDLGAKNDHDSLGLFQQRPSMGWGTAKQVTDPVFAATAFYLALQHVPGWESKAVTVAAQSVQRSAFPRSYAQWETDATSLVQEVLCNAQSTSVS